MIEIAVALVAVFGALSTAALAHRQKMTQVAADDERRHTDRNSKLLDGLQEEVRRLSAELLKTRGLVDQLYSQQGQLRVELAEAQIGNRVLTNQVVELGAVPAWAPIDEKAEVTR